MHGLRRFGVWGPAFRATVSKGEAREMELDFESAHAVKSTIVLIKQVSRSPMLISALVDRNLLGSTGVLTNAWRWLLVDGSILLFRILHRGLRKAHVDS